MRAFLKVVEDENDKFNFWRVRHNQALRSPIGFEFAIIYMLEGLEQYRNTHQEQYGTPIEQDYVLSEGVKDIAQGIRVLLNGEHGRLDAGTIDGYLVALLTKCGVSL